MKGGSNHSSLSGAEDTVQYVGAIRLPIVQNVVSELITSKRAPLRIWRRPDIPSADQRVQHTVDPPRRLSPSNRSSTRNCRENMAILLGGRNIGSGCSSRGCCVVKLRRERNYIVKTYSDVGANRTHAHSTPGVRSTAYPQSETSVSYGARLLYARDGRSPHVKNMFFINASYVTV